MDECHAWRHHHQHDIKGQNVEVAELMTEQDEADVRTDGVVEDRRRIVPLEKQRVLQQERSGGQHGDGDHRDRHLCDIDGDGAAEQAMQDGARRPRIVGRPHDMAQRPAGEEDEQLG